MSHFSFKLIVINNKPMALKMVLLTILISTNNIKLFFIIINIILNIYLMYYNITFTNIIGISNINIFIKCLPYNKMIFIIKNR